MSNRVVEVTRRSWGSRLMNSVGGVIFGVLLFFGSFFVLWRTEGRTDMSKIAARSTAVNAATINPATEGQLIAANGRLTSNETVGDPDYLAAGPYITLERQVEMFAWVERSSSSSQRSAGGSETTTTEYTYDTTWTANPPNASNFREPDGHHNPGLTIQRQSYSVNSAQVGAYGVDANRLSLPAARDVNLNNENVAGGRQLSGNYIYIGQGTLQQPQVGDVRISYRAVPASIEVTVFGKQESGRIVPYVDGRDSLYSAYAGDRDSGIAAMASAYRTAGWIGRVAGFIFLLILGGVAFYLERFRPAAAPAV